MSLPPMKGGLPTMKSASGHLALFRPEELVDGAAGRLVRDLLGR